MKNKKILIVAIIIIIISAILFGIYKIYDSYLFSSDGSIIDGHKELIERIKKIEDKEEKENIIDISLEKNFITQEEANELY